MIFLIIILIIILFLDPVVCQESQSKFIANIIENFEYKTNSWVLNANFNYLHPRESILNIAYPSAIANYFVTIIPSYSKYLFSGKFIEKNMYESSLTVYYQNGTINFKYPSINTFNQIEVNSTIINNSSELLFIFQRFYGNMFYYTKKDLINNLLQVYDLDSEKNLPKLNNLKRDYYSSILYQPLQIIFSKIAPISNDIFTKFYLPDPSYSGLFPDQNHYYLISNLNNCNILKIKGNFKSSKLTPYMDFITVNQDTIKTDQGLPFYLLNSSYQFYVVSPSVTNNQLTRLNITNSIILKWDYKNNKPALLFRIIDYSHNGISNISGPLNPYETKKNMKYGFYPEIEIIQLKI